MSVVATGSKLLNSGEAGPEVNAKAAVGETISISKFRIKKEEIILFIRLLRTLRNMDNVLIMFLK